MRLLEVSLQNYKSLRSVTLKPGARSVFIGPNGAGKSNLCDALDFIGEMYRVGLEQAVARHGGYENICFRHTRRSKSPVSLRVVASFKGDESLLYAWRGSGQERSPREIVVDHTIAFQTIDQQINAPFNIVEESVDYRASFGDGNNWTSIFSLTRSGDRIIQLDKGDTFAENFQFFPAFLRVETSHSFEVGLPPTESLLKILERYIFPLNPSGRSLGSIDIYQIHPRSCRMSGVPTPNAELHRDGENLPAVVNALKSRAAREYQIVLDTLRVIMPTLQDIDVVTTPQRTLGLAFQEVGFGRPWTSEDVSDGTIRALGLLASLFNPDSDVVIIEEPENSLHPWAIGQFVEACRVASESKQVMLTTHSPVLINHLRPEELWVVEKANAETRVTRLVDLDPDARVGWEEGRFTLSEYLDSGIVPGAVPIAPS